MKRSHEPARRRWLKRMQEGAVRRDGPPAEYRARGIVGEPTMVAEFRGEDTKGPFRFVLTTPMTVQPSDAFAWQSTNHETVGATLNGKWLDGRIVR